MADLGVPPFMETLILDFPTIKGLITALSGPSAPFASGRCGAAMGCASSAALPRDPQQAARGSRIFWASLGNCFGTSWDGQVVAKSVLICELLAVFCSQLSP